MRARASGRFVAWWQAWRKEEECTPGDNAAIVENIARVIDRRPKSIRRMAAARESEADAEGMRVGDVVTARSAIRIPEEFARQSERATLPPPPRAPSDAPELVSGTMEVFWPVEATTIPSLAVARDDLEWFDIPPLARKLLEHTDGMATIEAICARSGIDLVDASNLFDDLVREGIVSTR